ncbi:DUF3179 domain-containing protein [Oleidesulfovibrio sp.]|uniref:DUF3179 domain-containing protein n=1 Tax=Oleidesulfovibrio sp. TaxID=2909707 RepID=UPI003A892C2E
MRKLTAPRNYGCYGRLPALLLCVAACLASFTASPILTQATAADFKAMQDAVIDTGIQYDNIPSLVKPSYVSVADASLSLDYNEPVFVLQLPQGVRIYPQYLMVWHEAVNEVTSDGTPVLLTYSPLTGAVAAYGAKAGRFETTFGVTGKLLNANTILYDRATNSMWPQILGTAIEGPLEGASLTRLPVLWTTWQKAAKRWPDALVLSRSTGYNRSYGKDPYGSYRSTDSYYQNSAITFPVMHTDSRFAPKEPMLGLTLEGSQIAIQKAEVKLQGAINFTLGTTPMVALYDRQLDAVRVFSRVVNEKTVSFFMRDRTPVDRESQSEWTAEGKCEFGMLREYQLKREPAMEVMWFAWKAFFPDTAVIPVGENGF